MSDDGKKPRLTPTALDPVSPFESTALRQDRAFSDAPTPASPRAPILPPIFRPLDPPTHRETQLTDPPTKVVRTSSFVELPSGSVVGEIYEIETRLGAGAMGEVYVARHVKLGKRVAIKVIGKRLSEDTAAIERFAMEARTLAQVQHPSIVAVEHVGELADGRAYFVMEHLRGESLYARLARGRIPLPEALRILDQMARGLDAAHGEGVIHRDLKPENVFLVHLPGEPPTVKLVDYGLAKLAAERSDLDQRAERTQSGVIIGTPMYMSPEQARGSDVDYRTDIYALGAVAYELLLGAVPFPHAKTAPELYAAHLHESPPLPRSIWPEIPPQLDLVVFAMVAKDPAHRPTLAQVRAVIAAVRAGASSQRAATEFVGRRAPRPRAWTAAVGILALAVGIAVGSILTSRSTGPRTEEPRPATPQGPIVTPAPPQVPSPQVTPIMPAPAAKEIAAPPRTRARGGSGDHAGSAAPHPQRSGSAAATTPTPPNVGASIKVVPAESTDAAPQPTKPPDKPTMPAIDRDRTVNPFARHNKVTP